jgi:hypothetical protein
LILLVLTCLAYYDTFSIEKDRVRPSHTGEAAVPQPYPKSLNNRHTFIGGSDARIIMGGDEAALLRPWQEKRGDGYLRLRCLRKRTPSSSPHSPMKGQAAPPIFCG